MLKLSLVLLVQTGAATTQTEPQHACSEIEANAVANRLSELPQDIRDDLLIMDKKMGDRGSPLLQTDAPTAAEYDYPKSRFVQALLIKGTWYVQVEIGMTSGVRTMGYSLGRNGRYGRVTWLYYGGPACESIRAAVKGVYNPGLFNF